MKNKIRGLAIASLFAVGLLYCGRMDYTAYNTRMDSATVLSVNDVECSDGNIYSVDSVGYSVGSSVNVYFDTMGTTDKKDDKVIKIKMEEK